MKPWAGMLAGLLVAAGSVRAQDVPGDQETVRRAVHVCAACHGEEGRSANRSIPSQTRSETGTLAYMWGVSALLDDAAINGLADYYAAQSPAAGKPGNAARVAAGRKIFVEGMPARGVRACASCHSDGGEGVSAFPRLAGQHADYVYAQLKVFGTRLRPHGVVMQAETHSMSSAEMRAVAEYVQSL
jgi:cytochrome c553